MQIEFENIILRDMRESDIKDYVRWWTVETTWADWDAPWEDLKFSEQNVIRWQEYCESVKNMTEDALRSEFEIEFDGRHIGWVGSYIIDEKYKIVDEVEEGQKLYCAIGIDICEPEIRGKGLGTNALRAFLNYLFENGAEEIYTQTWSGNIRMIRCAQKLGFVECNRYVGLREVRGQKYDGLTFRLKKQDMIH